MRIIVHRVDAPFVTGHVMRRVSDAIKHRISHLHVRARHVDLPAQNMLAIFEFAGSHARNRSNSFFAALAIWAVLPGVVTLPR